MTTPTTDSRQLALLTPQEAALRLLEEATQQSFRSGGIEGLWPVNVGHRKMFRPQDVESFIRAKLQGAA
jgi:hypothetical protein